MKKIMILGGSVNQLPLIECAKQQGYYTIVCDYNSNNPGTKIADKYYQQDYMSIEKILDIAKVEKINGIISNSEAAVYTVSFVADKLHLVGNTLESVEILLSKSKFRQLQKDIGVFSPAFFETDDIKEALAYIKSVDGPVIVKPSECSGSRGTHYIYKASDRLIETVVKTCVDFSRNSRVTIEDYIQMPKPSVYDAEIFVINGKVFWDGLYLSERLQDNPFIPSRVVMPLVLPKSQINKIKTTVEKILKKTNTTYGEFNVETYLTDDDEVFVVEINPRQGGNNIPLLVEEHSSIDYTKLLVTTAMKDNDYYHYVENAPRKNSFISEIVVFSKEEGILRDVYIDDLVKRNVLWVKYELQIGEYVNKKSCAGDAVAWITLKFETYEDQCRLTKDIEQYIYPIVK